MQTAEAAAVAAARAEAVEADARNALERQAEVRVSAPARIDESGWEGGARCDHGGRGGGGAQAARVAAEVAAAAAERDAERAARVEMEARLAAQAAEHAATRELLEAALQTRAAADPSTLASRPLAGGDESPRTPGGGGGGGAFEDDDWLTGFVRSSIAKLKPEVLTAYVAVFERDGWNSAEMIELMPDVETTVVRARAECDTAGYALTRQHSWGIRRIFLRACPRACPQSRS